MALALGQPRRVCGVWCLDWVGQDANLALSSTHQVTLRKFSCSSRPQFPYVCNEEA